MGVPKQIQKIFSIFKGLDKRSSDFVRTQEYASELENGRIRSDGALIKRPGYGVINGASDTKSGAGLYTWSDIDESTGEITERIITLDTKLRKIVKKSINFTYTGELANVWYSITTNSERNKKEMHVTVDFKAYGECDEGIAEHIDQTICEGANDHSEGTPQNGHWSLFKTKTHIFNLDTGIDASDVSLANLATSLAAINITLSHNGNGDELAAHLSTDANVIIYSGNGTDVDIFVAEELVHCGDVDFTDHFNSLKVNDINFPEKSTYENATFANINSNIYIATESTYLMKFDGKRVYRAGIPKPDKVNYARSLKHGDNQINGPENESVLYDGKFGADSYTLAKSSGHTYIGADLDEWENYDQIPFSSASPIVPPYAEDGFEHDGYAILAVTTTPTAPSYIYAKMTSDQYKKNIFVDQQVTCSVEGVLAAFTFVEKKVSYDGTYAKLEITEDVITAEGSSGTNTSKLFTFAKGRAAMFTSSYARNWCQSNVKGEYKCDEEIEGHDSKEACEVTGRQDHSDYIEERMWYNPGADPNNHYYYMNPLLNDGYTTNPFYVPKPINNYGYQSSNHNPKANLYKGAMSYGRTYPPTLGEYRWMAQLGAGTGHWNYFPGHNTEAKCAADTGNKHGGTSDWGKVEKNFPYVSFQDVTIDYGGSIIDSYVHGWSRNARDGGMYFKEGEDIMIGYHGSQWFPVGGISPHYLQKGEYISMERYRLERSSWGYFRSAKWSKYKVDGDYNFTARIEQIEDSPDPSILYIKTDHILNKGHKEVFRGGAEITSYGTAAYKYAFTYVYKDANGLTIESDMSDYSESIRYNPTDKNNKLTAFNIDIPYQQDNDFNTSCIKISSFATESVDGVDVTVLSYAEEEDMYNLVVGDKLYIYDELFVDPEPLKQIHRCKDLIPGHTTKELCERGHGDHSDTNFAAAGVCKIDDVIVGINTEATCVASKGEPTFVEDDTVEPVENQVPKYGAWLNGCASYHHHNLETCTADANSDHGGVSNWELGWKKFQAGTNNIHTQATCEAAGGIWRQPKTEDEANAFNTVHGTSYDFGDGAVGEWTGSNWTDSDYPNWAVASGGWREIEITAIDTDNKKVTLKEKLTAGAVLDTTNGRNIASAGFRIRIWRTTNLWIMNSQMENPLPDFFLVEEVANYSKDNSTGTSLEYKDTYPNDYIISQGAYTTPMKDRGLPPKGKYISAWNKQLIVAGIKDEVNVLHYSDYESPEYFPSWTNSILINTKLGDKITGIAPLGKTLYAFQRKSIHTITGDLINDAFKVSLLSTAGEVGCESHHTITEIHSKLFFLARSGVFSVQNGTGAAQEISARVSPLFDYQKYSFARAVAINWNRENLFLLYVPKESTATLNSVNDALVAESNESLLLCYDHYREAWMTWTNLDFGGGITIKDGNVFFNSRKKGNTTLSMMGNKKDSSDFNDNHLAIPFTYSTHWEALGEPSIPKKFLRVKIHSLDPEDKFETPKFSINVKSSRDYSRDNLSNLKLDYLKYNMEWGNPNSIDVGIATWGFDPWGDYTKTALKHKLPTGASKSFKLTFKNNNVNENVLISGYELEIANPYGIEIKD